MNRAEPTSRTWQLGLGLAGLYLAQGLVHGTQGTLVLIAAAQGRSLEAQAGLLAWGALPWVLKFVWGVLEDRLLPRDARRHARVLLGLQLGVALAMLPLARGFDGAAAPYLLFGLNLILSWQDIATDAFAIDHIPTTLRGRVNAVMGGARALGATVLGGIVFIAALPRLGVAGCIHASVAGLALLGLAPLLLSRSAPVAPPAEAPRQPFEWVAGLRPSLALLCALTLLGDGLGSAVNSEFLLNTAGWSLEDAANVLRPAAAVAELAGFALAAVIVDRLGPRRAIAAGATALGLVWAAMALASGLWTEHALILGVATIEGLARACVIVGVYSLCMASVDARARATQFLIYMALINLGPALGAWIAPKLFAAWSFPGVWSCAASLQLCLVALVWASPSSPAHSPDSGPARGSAPT